MKILKNTTGSAIELSVIGLSIPASSQITIEVQDYLLLGSSDSTTEIDPLITSGDVVVNDGTSDLSVSEGQNYIRYADNANNILFTDSTTGLVSNTTREAIDEVGNTADEALNTPRYTIALQPQRS